MSDSKDKHGKNPTGRGTSPRTKLTGKAGTSSGRTGRQQHSPPAKRAGKDPKGPGKLGN